WVFAITYMTLWAYCLALVIFQIGGLILGVVPFSFFTVCAFLVLGTFLYLLFRKDAKPQTALKIASKTI
ncbi:MAG: hypothetical protein MR514_08325, partial [Succinivibrio sp.]|nr:hypothetical protein [Succinivibrio sp.]